MVFLISMVARGCSTKKLAGQVLKVSIHKYSAQLYRAANVLSAFIQTSQ